jgi:hypothetical protein
VPTRDEPGALLVFKTLTGQRAVYRAIFKICRQEKENGNVPWEPFRGSGGNDRGNQEKTDFIDRDSLRVAWVFRWNWEEARPMLCHGVTASVCF